MSERIKRSAPVDAVLLGGKDAEARGFNSNYKFTLEMNGRDILEGVLEAIDATEQIDRVFFVGPLEIIDDRVEDREKGYITVPDTGSLWGNLSETIDKQQQMRGGNEVLVVCSDLPFLTAESMDWLVENSSGKDRLQVPTVPRDTIHQLSPAYETYYWPMREYPFKWSNNLLLDVNNIPNSQLATFFTEYRETFNGSYTQTALNRLKMIREHGGSEAVYTLMLNYASKLLQMKFGNTAPFSRLRSKQDYEKVISDIIGTDTELLQIPFADVALDVDNHLRLDIFKRGYNDIRQVIQRQATTNSGKI